MDSNEGNVSYVPTVVNLVNYSCGDDSENSLSLKPTENHVVISSQINYSTPNDSLNISRVNMTDISFNVSDVKSVHNNDIDPSKKSSHSPKDNISLSADDIIADDNISLSADDEIKMRDTNEDKENQNYSNINKIVSQIDENTEMDTLDESLKADTFLSRESEKHHLDLSTVTSINQTTDETNVSEYKPDNFDKKVDSKLIVTLTKKITIPTTSANGKGGNKKYFCPIENCNTSVQKFARHLEDVHPNEPEVINFRKYPKGSKPRADAIRLLRNRGQMLFNSNEEFNLGTIQVARQCPVGVQKTSETLEFCADCNGQYSFKSIRNHKCVGKDPNKYKPDYTSRARGRAKFIHCSLTNLSQRMREDIIATFNRSAIRDIITEDPHILKFGEHKCKKLPEPHHNNYIKSQMTYAAKLLQHAREINADIKDIKSLLQCQNYDTIYEGIKYVADWNPDTNSFTHPSVATVLTTLVIEMSKRIEVEIIKSKDSEGIKSYQLGEIQRFQSLVTKEFTADINKIAIKNYAKSKSQKQEKKTDEEDVKLLYEYIEKKLTQTCDDVEKLFESSNFDHGKWMNLVQYLVIYLIILNKKRVGEASRITISDYSTMKKITPQDPTWQNLTEEEQKQANEYGRFTITGKLYRMVPVLMNVLLIRGFDLVLKTRESAGVKSCNPYIFGLPSGKNNKYIEPGPLFVQFSKECGAKNPSNLRGTPIRKNLATHILNKKADDGTVKSTANFMGHAKGIHEGVYQDHTVTDILLVSKSLESAVGKTEKKGTEKTKPIVKETVIKGKKKTEKKKVESETSMDSSQISLDISVPRRKSKRIIPKLKLTSKLNFSDEDIVGTSDESPPKKKSKKSLPDKKKNKKRSDSDEEYCKKSQSSESDDSSHSVHKNYLSSSSNNTEIKKKPRWSEDDKFKLCEIFIASMKMKKVPSNAAMRLAISNHEFLRKKNEATIRTFLTRILNTPEMYSKYMK